MAKGRRQEDKRDFRQSIVMYWKESVSSKNGRG